MPISLSNVVQSCHVPYVAEPYSRKKQNTHDQHTGYHIQCSKPRGDQWIYNARDDIVVQGGKRIDAEAIYRTGYTCQNSAAWCDPGRPDRSVHGKDDPKLLTS